MRWYALDEVNQEESGQNEVDRMKKGADSTGEVMHIWKSGWWFVMRKIQMVELWWQQMRSEFYLKTEQRWDCVGTIRYDTIGEFNVDSKAEYSALSSTRSQKKKLKQTTPVPLWYSTGWDPWRKSGWLVIRTLWVSDRSLYSMRSLILSQCRDLRSQDGCDMKIFRIFNHSAYTRQFWVT